MRPPYMPARGVNTLRAWHPFRGDRTRAEETNAVSALLRDSRVCREPVALARLVRTSLVIEPVDIRLVFEQAMEDTRAYAKSYGVRITLQASTMPCELQSDAGRLVQIVANLLSNAIKFSPRGGEVVIAAETRSGGTRISVRDHGCGIPEDFKREIFEKFARADGSDTRQRGGTGLGLTIVKQLVTQLGGEVGFYDAPGGGTTFYVDLPGTPPVDTLGGQQQASGIADPHTGSGLRGQC